MSEKLFSEDFIANLPEMSRFDNPMVVRLCKSTMPSTLKLRAAIEKWYQELDPSAKGDLKARLQSQEDEVFNAAFFELALKQHFEESAFGVEFEPELDDGTTPDFRLTAEGAELYVEVRTIMEAEEVRLNRKRKNDALVQLDKIETKYILSVHFEEEPEANIKPSTLRREVDAWLKVTEIPENGSDSRIFQSGGYTVEITARNRPEYGEGSGRIMFSGGPVGFLGHSLGLMYRGIRKKAGKYKDLQKAGKPYVVAICSTDMNFVLEDIWMTLAAYGSLEGQMNNRGSFSLSGEKPKNKGVSGILHCKLLYDKENFGFEINFYENPFAGTKVPDEFSWRNKDETKQNLGGCLPWLTSLFFGIGLSFARLLWK